MHAYEHLDLWQRGLDVASKLQRISREVAHWSDRDLWRQLTRAASSIPANVAEGAQRGSDREFARFLAIAMGSAAELHSLLLLAQRSGVLIGVESTQLVEDAQRLRRMASALRARALGLPTRRRATPSSGAPQDTPRCDEPPEP